MINVLAAIVVSDMAMPMALVTADSHNGSCSDNTTAVANESSILILINI